MLKKRIAISKIITITLIPLTTVGKINFNRKTIMILSKSFKKIFFSFKLSIKNQQQHPLSYSQMRLPKRFYFSK